MLEHKPKSMVGTSRLAGQKQRPRQSSMIFALAVLLAGITVLLITDRNFWFGSNPLILDSDGTETTAAPQTGSAPSGVQRHQPAAAPATKHASVATSIKAKNAASPADTTTRSVLPPLDVEVIAGNAHRTIHAGTSSKIEVLNAAPNAQAPTDAAGRERISPEAAQPASYPLLAQHMNVQGSVVLKALIGADGTIEDLHILSGPSILAAAAQQAVREWHFKPVIQNGQPVETMAKIVVNFSIKVADDSDKTTLAEGRSDGLIFTR
jgi:TonB family protein